MVFSTSVEVFLRSGEFERFYAQSSPRPWRCFLPRSDATRWRAVFSTSVEVFLQDLIRSEVVGRLLHVRGGVSDQTAKALGCVRSSPRPWRCFFRIRFQLLRHGVFSTSVEVFPTPRPGPRTYWRLLHVRGGVSIVNCLFKREPGSSPRPWRCFLNSQGLKIEPVVFSTSVEVFPARDNRAASG